MTIKNKSCPSLTEPKHGKPVRILVWINGDFESPQQEVRLNPSDLRSWNGVLSILTQTLNPRFGAVRKLYHLRTRKMVECLKHIQPDDRFVAVGVEKFRVKKNGYLTEEERQLQKNKSLKGSIRVEENVKSLLNFMDYTKKKKRTVIYVMVSGRSCQEPLKVVLTRDDFKVWNMILEYLGYQLDVEEGVQFLCKINGKIIFKPEELRHGELYVAVPFNGKFIRMDYIKLFEELRPNKTIKVRKPKKTRSAVFATNKKYKSKPCVNTKCHADCSQLPSPKSGSTVHVQTVVSGSITPLFSKGDKDKDSTDGRGQTSLGDSTVHVQTVVSGSINPSSSKGDKDEDSSDDRGQSSLDVQRTYLREIAKEFSEDSDDDGTYNLTDLVKSVVDEVVEDCLLELEQEGRVGPPDITASRVSVALSDKIFFPDPEEKNLNLPAPQKTVVQEPLPHIASCCATAIAQGTSDDQVKIMTTFAEIARKEEEKKSRTALPRESQTSLSISDTEGYKSVTFLQTGSGLQVQETIFEENEPIVPNLDTESQTRQSPKASILKMRKSGQADEMVCNDKRAKFCLQVPIKDMTSSSEDHDDDDDFMTQALYESIKRSSSFSKPTRDSIMVTADRLLRATSHLNHKLSTTATQKSLSDTGENDKSVQAFEDNNVAKEGKRSISINENGNETIDKQKQNHPGTKDGGQSQHPQGRASQELYYVPNRSLSDIYENYDPSSDGANSFVISTHKIQNPASKSQSETDKKGISFDKMGTLGGGKMARCCADSASHLLKSNALLETGNDIKNGNELGETSKNTQKKIASNGKHGNNKVISTVNGVQSDKESTNESNENLKLNNQIEIQNNTDNLGSNSKNANSKSVSENPKKTSSRNNNSNDKVKGSINGNKGNFDKSKEFPIIRTQAQSQNNFDNLDNVSNNFNKRISSNDNNNKYKVSDNVNGNGNEKLKNQTQTNTDNLDNNNLDTNSKNSNSTVSSETLQKTPSSNNSVSDKVEDSIKSSKDTFDEDKETLPFGSQNHTNNLNISSENFELEARRKTSQKMPSDNKNDDDKVNNNIHGENIKLKSRHQTESNSGNLDKNENNNSKTAPKLRLKVKTNIKDINDNVNDNNDYKKSQGNQSKNSIDNLDNNNKIVNSKAVQDVQDNEGQSRTLNRACLRENCATFACSEIFLNRCKE